jgi:hypothetical protein
VMLQLVAERVDGADGPDHIDQPQPVAKGHFTTS